MIKQFSVKKKKNNHFSWVIQTYRVSKLSGHQNKIWVEINKRKVS